MKTILLLSILLLAKSGFALTYDNAGSSVVFIKAHIAETGYVDNLFGVQKGLDGSLLSPLLIGKTVEGSIEKNFVSIITFDTSVVPLDAHITAAALLVSVRDTNGNNIQHYLEEHVVVDVSGSLGFGGSFTITGFDYYASAMSSIQSVAGIPFASDGLLLHSDSNGNYRDLNYFFNKLGKTQLRLRLGNNPANQLINLYAAGADDLGTHIALILVWE